MSYNYNGKKFLSLPEQVEVNRREIKNLEEYMNQNGYNLFISHKILDELDILNVSDVDVYKDIKIGDLVVGPNGVARQIIDMTSITLNLSSDSVDLRSQLEKIPLISSEDTSFMNKISILDTSLCLVDLIPKYLGYNDDLTDDANTEASSDYVTSQVFEVNAGEKYVFNTSHYGNNIYIANSTKKLTSVVEVNANTVWTVPVGAKYFRLVFTINGSKWNNDQWLTKAMLIKGDSLENVTPFGTNQVKNLNLEDGSISEAKLDDDLKDLIVGGGDSNVLIVPRGTSYSAGEAILLLNFDGWNQNTFDIMAPYLQNLGIPFTLFFAGYDNATGINPYDLMEYKKARGDDFEFDMYSYQELAVASGTTNYAEQFAVLKGVYDGFINYGINKPKCISYKGGIYSSLTEDICKNFFGLKIGRSTENSAIIKEVTTAFTIPCSSYGDDSQWPITTVDSIINGAHHRALMTHNILSDAVTDTTYNMSEANLKLWVDYIATKIDSGELKAMTFHQYYLYTILPHTASIGKHAIVWENDNKQHEYVYLKSGWKEV